MGWTSKKKEATVTSSTTTAWGADHPCAQLRAAYHDCFNRWYAEKFSKGQCDKEECVSEWEKYRACLSQHLEDKHLRRILLESEGSTSTISDDFNSEDADGDSRRG